MRANVIRIMIAYYISAIALRLPLSEAMIFANINTSPTPRQRPSLPQ
jgi:hypothetical protein